MDRTTDFRDLGARVRAGLVRRIDTGDHVWRFELTTRKAIAADVTDSRGDGVTITMLLQSYCIRLDDVARPR